jgi:hypothetical protein
MTAATYGLDVTGAAKGQKHPQQTFGGFYRHIHDNCCRLDDAGWVAFRQNLSSRIASNCNRLRNEKVRELDAGSVSPPSSSSVTPPPATPNSDETSSSPSPDPSPVLSYQQRTTENSTTANSALQNQQIFPPLASPGTTINSHRYTSRLKEHADIQGETVSYQKKCLSDYPPSWHYTATLGDLCAEGTGRNLTQAKHAASKQLCEMMGLSIS